MQDTNIHKFRDVVFTDPVAKANRDKMTEDMVDTMEITLEKLRKQRQFGKNAFTDEQINKLFSEYFDRVCYLLGYIQQGNDVINARPANAQNDTLAYKPVNEPTWETNDMGIFDCACKTPAMESVMAAYNMLFEDATAGTTPVDLSKVSSDQADELSTEFNKLSDIKDAAETANQNVSDAEKEIASLLMQTNDTQTNTTEA